MQTLEFRKSCVFIRNRARLINEPIADFLAQCKKLQLLH